VHIYMWENSFNLMSCNPEILIIQHLRREDPRIFTGKEICHTGKEICQWKRQIFGSCSKRPPSTWTVVVFLDPCSPP